MSILVPYRGVIEIVGEHDTGKTLAALGVVSNYNKSIFVDDDLKSSATIKQLVEANIFPQENYIDLASKRDALGDSVSFEDILYKAVFPTVQQIVSSKKKYELIVWDTWRTVYQSARGYVDRNKKKYNHLVSLSNSGEWIGTREIIQGLVSKIARGIEQKIIIQLKNSCDILIITHHIKAKYTNNVEVGVIPESSTTFSEVCNMRIWLRFNTHSKIPVMIFLKRPNVPVVKKTGVEFVNVVPSKITPNKEDKSIWQAIARYEKNPFESREPVEGEILTKEELSLVTNTLTDEQKLYMLEVLKYQKLEAEAISQSINEPKDNRPSTGLEMLNMAKEKWKANFSMIKEILEKPNYKLDEYVKEDWDILKEHFNKDK